jgi:hypothetical protein
MSSAKGLHSAEERERVDRHLAWLVEARYKNQLSGLEIRKLLNHPKAREWNLSIVQALVGACFSLWRAAFLADKKGVREDVFKHASTFLDEMIANNIIAYTQDRSAREWTFNYYATNAARALWELDKKWSSIGPILSESDKPTDGFTRPQKRWERNQRALDEAIKCFQQHLGDPISADSSGSQPRKKK